MSHNPNQQQAPQGPQPSFVNTDLAVVAALLPTLATIAVVLRFVARRKKRSSPYRADDWALWITLLMCWGHSINTLVAGAQGGFNYIKLKDRLEFANITLRTLWVSLFFLITALYTVKISILIFYYNLFYINETFRKAVKIMMVVITAWFIASFVCQVLSTDPIDASWDAKRARHRFNFNAWYITYSGLSILFDIVILCFPLPVVKHLKVTTKQKFSIMGIFWLGGFVCVSAIVRFVFLYNSIYKLKTLTGGQYSLITKAFIWAEVEPNTAVIAACLPTYGPFFVDNTFGSGIIASLKSVFHISSSKTPSSGSGTGFNSGKTHPSKELSSSNASEGGYFELDKTATLESARGDVESQRHSDDRWPLAKFRQERERTGRKI